MPGPTSEQRVYDELAPLVYELLDAHADTMRLAEEIEWDGDLCWDAHLDYLRALQRVGRDRLAHASCETGVIYAPTGNARRRA